MSRLKLAVLRWLLTPQGIERGYVMTHIGQMSIAVAPKNTTGLTHDAQRAIVCGDHVVLFYGPSEEWNP